MVRRDMSSGLPRSGTYEVEVAKVEVASSKKTGDLYVKLTLKEVGSGRFLCDDFLMLEGRGMFFGNRKLKAFGMDPKAEDVDEFALIGRRAYAALIVEERENYEPRLKVNNSAEDSLAGYWPEGSPPAEFAGGSVAPIDPSDIAAGPILPDDTPF